MLPTTPNIPNNFDKENMFINQLKALLRLYAQTVNMLEERIAALESKK